MYFINTKILTLTGDILMADLTKIIEEIKKDPTFPQTKERFDALFEIKVGEMKADKDKLEKEENDKKPKGIFDMIFGSPKK